MESCPESSDDHLIREVLKGRRDAYAHLVRRYERRVHAAAWAILKNHQAAEDATQETFIKAFGKLTTLRTGAKFRAWLLAIVRRTATDCVRDRKRLVFVPTLPERPALDLPVSDGPNDEDAALLLSVLACLTDREQDVLLLRDFDDLDVADIAARFGCPVGTVTKQISRALARLRDRLKETS